MPDTAFYALVPEGMESSGPRGYSPSLARSVRDVDEFVRFAASDSQVGLEEVVVIAQSVGAVLVATDSRLCTCYSRAGAGFSGL